MQSADPYLNLWLAGLVIVLLAGLNAPLGLVAVQLVIAGMGIATRPDLVWIVGPVMLWVWIGALALQFAADLYFIPATAKDRSYLNPQRVVNAYLHARFQSLVRPAAAALAFAALPLPLPAQSAAVIGFVGGAAVYWTTAWIREQVAISRGALLLVLLELGKELAGLIIAGLVAFLPLVALALVLGPALLTTLWAARLQRERSLYGPLGGQVASEDS